MNIKRFIPSLYTISTIAIISTFFGAFYCIESQLWEKRKDIIYTLEKTPGMIPDKESTKVGALGFDNFLADIYWIKAVQYMGTNVFTEKTSLFTFIDLITKLDPTFEEAYRIAVLLLPDTGAMKETEELINKWQKNIPDSPQAYFSAGYFYFFYQENPEEAIKNYEKCITLEGCLGGANRLVKSLKIQAGKYEVAINEYIEVLKDPDLGDDEIQIAKNKIHMAADLFILNQATKYIDTSNIESINDFEGFSFTPDRQVISFLTFLQKISSATDYSPVFDGKAVSISAETLISPFEFNPYIWDNENKKIRTERF